MAKLPRTTQKIFGKNAPESQITTFGSIKAGTPVYTQSASQIMNSAFEGGWSEAVEDDYSPYRQDRNAVDTAITQQLAYLFQDGIPEWDAGTTYYKGSVVKVVNGNALTFYKSIADNNTASVNTTASWHKMLEINASNQIVSPTINTPTISGGSMSNGTFSNPTFSGTVNVPLASQSSSTDSTIAASIGWVNNPSLSSNVLHKTGDETIGGHKTFTGGARFQSTTVTPWSIVKTNLTKGTAPSSNVETRMMVYDSNGDSSYLNLIAGVWTEYNSNGNITASLRACKPESGAAAFADIRVIYPATGDPYTYALTPATSDNSTKIATTAFVKSVLSSSGNGLATYSKAKNGYYKFANGLIIQWGEVASGTNIVTVTLPTAFTSTNYQLSAQQVVDNNQESWPPNVGNKTTTAFNLNTRGGAVNIPKSWIAIGY